MEGLMKIFNESLAENFKGIEYPYDLASQRIISYKKLEKLLFGDMYRIYHTNPFGCLRNPKLIKIDGKNYILDDIRNSDSDLLEVAEETLCLSIQDFIFTPYGIMPINLYKNIMSKEKLHVKLNIRFIMDHDNIPTWKIIKFKKEYIIDNSNTLLSLYEDLKKFIESKTDYILKDYSEIKLYEIGLTESNISYNIIHNMLDVIMKELNIKLASY